jgi:toxin FitB
MIVLDTNVLSELMKSQPNTLVVRWIERYQATSLFITTLAQAEILYGLEILSAGKRRNALKKAAKAMFELDFTDRILPFDTNVAQLFATIAAKRRKIGHPISQIDAQIAAITRSHNATLATRNIDYFTDCDIEIINPWE